MALNPDTISLLNGKNTLLSHAQLGVYQDSQIRFCGPAFWLGGSQHIAVSEVFLAQMKDFALCRTCSSCQPTSPVCQGPSGFLICHFRAFFAPSHFIQLLMVEVHTQDVSDSNSSPFPNKPVFMFSGVPTPFSAPERCF